MTLPMGSQVRLAHAVRRLDDGRVLVGGAPLTLMRLSAVAHRFVSDGRVIVSDAASAALADRLLDTNLGHPDLQHVSPVCADDVTVVVPVRDRADQLDRALSSLDLFRVVVVDDASQDSEAVRKAAWRHGAHVLKLPANVGPGGARNAGLATVTTPFVAFVDCDVRVTSATILNLTRHFDDPSVVLVGPRITGVCQSARSRWFERYDVVASSLDLGRWSAVVRPGGAVGWLPGACLVARTSGLDDGFNPALRVGEDVDLVWRLVRAGRRVRYDATARALHEARSSLRGWLERKFSYGTSGASLARRHGRQVAPAALSPAFALAAAALLLRRRWTLPVAAAAWALGIRNVRRVLPPTAGRNATSVRIAAVGLAWAVRQGAGLVLRHWWPATVVAAVATRSMRRSLVSALVVDALVGLRNHRNADKPFGLMALAVGRRLDDLAYGTGLWWGALRERSPRALLPRSPRA